MLRKNVSGALLLKMSYESFQVEVGSSDKAYGGTIFLYMLQTKKQQAKSITIILTISMSFFIFDLDYLSIESINSSYSTAFNADCGASFLLIDFKISTLCKYICTCRGLLFSHIRFFSFRQQTYQLLQYVLIRNMAKSIFMYKLLINFIEALQFSAHLLISKYQLNNFKNIENQLMLDQISHPTEHRRDLPRKSHINRIRNQLKSFPLLSKNKTMVEKKISMQSEILSETISTDGLSTENDESSVIPTFEHVEIFAQKYQITEKLGQGSNGVVHCCIKKRSGKIYAVKTLMFDDEQLLQLKSNFFLIKNLRHRNLIQYQALYIDLQKHACWLVMEYIEAKPLSLVPISSEQELREIIQQLFEILHYLHQRAVAHRDIKLQNILYDPVEKKLKLIDYGICRKHRRRGSKFDMLTITGTLFYRAPEMFNGGGYNQKIDIWAVGVLLYKIITGKTPFQSEYHSQTISNIRNSEINFPSIFQEYSPQLQTLIQRLLNKNASERPTALQCLRDSWFCKNHFEGRLHKKSIDLEEDEEGLMSPIIENLLDMKSYIRKINGQQFHCIDSDDEGPRRSLKRQHFHHHRSLLLELNNFTL